MKTTSLIDTLEQIVESTEWAAAHEWNLETLQQMFANVRGLASMAMDEAKDLVFACNHAVEEE